MSCDRNGPHVCPVKRRVTPSVPGVTLSRFIRARQDSRSADIGRTSAKIRPMAPLHRRATVGKKAGASAGPAPIVRRLPDSCPTVCSSTRATCHAREVLTRSMCRYARSIVLWSRDRLAAQREWMSLVEWARRDRSSSRTLPCLAAGARTRGRRTTPPSGMPYFASQHGGVGAGGQKDQHGGRCFRTSLRRDIRRRCSSLPLFLTLELR
jgi:hypothetical protein